MKLYNYDKMIRENHYKQVTSPNLFTAQGTPDPDGLVSNVIFGITTQDRQNLYGYIDLGERFIHPLIYKRVLKRSWRDIDSLLNGSMKFSIDSKGLLVPDENGGTGMKWLYDNFEKIKFKNIDIIEGEDNDAIENSIFKKDVRALFAKNSKELIFPNKIMVIPVAFRDVDMKDGYMGIDTLNGLYRSVITKVKSLKENKLVKLFDQDRIRFQILMQLCEISDYFKGVNFGKRGLQRKRALSKNVDFGSIIVMSAREFQNDAFDGEAVGIDRSGFPLTSVLANCFLFINRRIQNFLLQSTMLDKAGNAISLTDKELYYDSEKIKEFNEIYLHSVSERFSFIKNPKEDGYVMFEYEENGQKKSRRLTITDLAYMFAYIAIELGNKHAMVTRHPTMDSFNIFPTKVHVLSTIRTKHIKAYGFDFPYYPDVDYILDKYNLEDTDEAIEAEREISGYFVESEKVSSLHFKGMNGDLDGDKTITRYVFSDEANAECERQMSKITNAFDLKLSNVKTLGNDSSLCLFSFTNKIKNANRAKKEIVDKLLAVEPKDITVSYLFKELRLADTVNFQKLNDIHDEFGINPGDYGLEGTEPINITLGMYIAWKLLFKECDIKLITVPWDKNVVEKTMEQLGAKIKDGIITMDTYKTMSDRYESFSMRMSSFVNPSVDSNMLSLTPEIIELRDKLLAENKEKLEANDIVVAGQVEDALIKKAKETYQDDPAYELYASGVTKLSNEFKTMALMQGSLPQDAEFNKFKVVTSSLNQGTEKSDIPYVMNSAVVGGYSRGKAPEEGGALAKNANYVFQTMMIDKHGTDCGTKVYPHITITPKVADEYVGRYVVEGDKLVLLTEENINKYKGKTVQMRSVLTCKSKSVCSKCAGEFLYQMYQIYDKPIAFGLKLSKQQHEIVQKRLKLSHDISLKFVDFSFDNCVASEKKKR